MRINASVKSRHVKFNRIMLKKCNVKEKLILLKM